MQIGDDGMVMDFGGKTIGFDGISVVFNFSQPLVKQSIERGFDTNALVLNPCSSLKWVQSDIFSLSLSILSTNCDI